jgi:uncharacterized protein (DUF2132 family)
MSEEQPNNPLHGLTLKAILEDLVERHGWPGLAQRINIACFHTDPSIASSLKFLRKTLWARTKVERIYLADARKIASKRKRNKRRAEMRAYKAAAATEGSEVATVTEAAPDSRASAAQPESPSVEPECASPDTPRTETPS